MIPALLWVWFATCSAGLLGALTLGPGQGSSPGCHFLFTLAGFFGRPGSVHCCALLRAGHPSAWPGRHWLVSVCFCVLCLSVLWPATVFVCPWFGTFEVGAAICVPALGWGGFAVSPTLSACFRQSAIVLVLAVALLRWWLDLCLSLHAGGVVLLQPGLIFPHGLLGSVE